MKEKQEKPKSVFQIAKEMEEAQQREEAEAEAKARELARQQEAQRRAEYEKKIRQERIELMRLKQGVIEESELIKEEKEEKKKYTLWQKIKNFFYHNTWWLWFAVFFVALGGFLVYQQIATVRPDMVVLLIVDDADFDAMCSREISALFEQYIEDENGDGNTVVEVYYIPASEDSASRNAYSGESTKLFAEFQMGDSLLVISDDAADEYIVAEENLEDLEQYFGEYEQIEDYRFLLSDTDFAEAVDWPYELDKDIYIGIRQVKPTFSFEEEMQKNYDIAFPALQKFIEEYGTLSDQNQE